MSVTPLMIVANLSMLQTAIGIRNVDGVYWTLFYELTFYGAVWLVLLVRQQRNLSRVFKFWPVVFCCALLIKVNSFPYLGGYYYYF